MSRQKAGRETRPAPCFADCRPDQRSGMAVEVPMLVVVPPDTLLSPLVCQLAPLALMPVVLSLSTLVTVRRTAPETAEMPVVQLAIRLLLAVRCVPLAVSARPVPQFVTTELLTLTKVLVPLAVTQLVVMPAR